MRAFCNGPKRSGTHLLAQVVGGLGCVAEQCNASYATQVGKVLQAKNQPHFLVLREPKDIVISTARMYNHLYHHLQLKPTTEGVFRHSQPITERIQQFIEMANDPSITVLFYDQLIEDQAIVEIKIKERLGITSDTAARQHTAFFTGESSDYKNPKWGWADYGEPHWNATGGKELDQLYQSTREKFL